MRQMLIQRFLKEPGGGGVRGCWSGQADVPAVLDATPNRQAHCPRAVSEVSCTWHWGEGLHQYSCTLGKLRNCWENTCFISFGSFVLSVFFEKDVFCCKIPGLSGLLPQVKYFGAGRNGRGFFCRAVRRKPGLS